MRNNFFVFDTNQINNINNINDTFYLIESEPGSSSSSSNNYNRTFEQLITERGEEYDVNNVNNINNNNSIFNNIFEKIKEKIFILGDCDIELIESDRKKYSKKYEIEDINIIIYNFKKNIVLLYNKKIELEIEIENKTKIYNDFLMNINSLITSINGIEHEDNKQLNTLLKNKIDWYYNYLNLDKLISEQFDIISEFSYLKSTIKNFNSISNTVICSICLEKQVSWFIDPCGHTICDDCKNKSEISANCHYCRHKKTKYNRLYL